MIGANPRYRIYGGLRKYTSVFADLLTGNRKGRKSVLNSFEERLCEYFGVKNAILTSQNRMGVYLTIKNTIRPGQGVIMSPYTIADIVNMVILAGGKPIFADTERDTCNIAAAEVKHLLQTNKNVGAVMITHLHGLAAPAHEILGYCNSAGVPLIEDAAQGFGARENGKKLGTIGKAGVFSFGMYKNINSWFGGLVITDDDQLAEAVRAELFDWEFQRWPFIFKKIKKGLLTDIATYPLIFRLFTFWVFRWAFLNDFEPVNKMVRTELDMTRKTELPLEYKARYTPAQARLAIGQLDTIDSNSETRIGYAKVYHEGLRDIPGLIISPWHDDFSHIYTYFPVQFAERERLLKFLMAENRDIAAQHYRNTADLEWFGEFFRDCPNSRLISEQLIFLPTYPSYGINEVKKNVSVIQKFFALEYANRPEVDNEKQQSQYRETA